MSFPELIRLEGIVIPDDATIETLKAACECNQSVYAKQYLTSEHFNVTVHGSRKLLLAHFNERVTSEHVEAVAEEMGFGTALTEDLLCVGAHPEHRELQRQSPIITLGSSVVVPGGRHVPYLEAWNGERNLCLNLYGYKWNDNCRFIFVDNNNVAA